MVRKLLYAGVFALIGLIGIPILVYWSNLLEFHKTQVNVCLYGDTSSVYYTIYSDSACWHRYNDALSYAHSFVPASIGGLFLGLAVIYTACFFILPALPKNNKIDRVVEKHPELSLCWLILVPLAFIFIVPNIGSEHIDPNAVTSNNSYPIYPNYLAIIGGLLLFSLGIGMFATAKKPVWFLAFVAWFKGQLKKEETTKKIQEEHEQPTEELEAIRLNPQSYVAWTNLGYKQHQLDLNEDALASANKAISLNKTYARAWMVRGAALSTMQEKEGDAHAALDEALALDENNIDAMYYKGQVYTFQEHDRLAHQIFDRVLARDPRYKDALLSKGALYIAAEDYDGALIFSDTIIKDFPDDPIGWRLRGQAYEGKGERIGARGNTEMGYMLLNDALASFDKALELDPRHAPTYFLKAQPYVAIGDYGKALESLNQGLKIEPNNKLLQEAMADIVGKRTSETASKVAGTAGRMALGAGAGLAKGSVSVAKIFFNALRKP